MVFFDLRRDPFGTDIDHIAYLSCPDSCIGYEDKVSVCGTPYKQVILTEDGRRYFMSQNVLKKYGWDVDYYNYKICIMDKAAVERHMDEIRKEISRLMSDFTALEAASAYLDAQDSNQLSLF